MRILPALFVAATMLLPGAAMAATYSSPEALLQSIYASYDTGEFPDDSEEIYSHKLKDLFALDRERTPEGEIGALDFDPFVNGQDYELTNVQIGTPEVSGQTAHATVTFDNFGDSNTLAIDMVEESDGWKVDDVASVAGEFQWKLSEILGGDPVDGTDPAVSN
jgi:hypothetical protein